MPLPGFYTWQITRRFSRRYEFSHAYAPPPPYIRNIDPVVGQRWVAQRCPNTGSMSRVCWVSHRAGPGVDDILDLTNCKRRWLADTIPAAANQSARVGSTVKCLWGERWEMTELFRRVRGNWPCQNPVRARATWHFLSTFNYRYRPHTCMCARGLTHPGRQGGGGGEGGRGI